MKKLFIYGDELILQNYKQAFEFCGVKTVFDTKIETAFDCDALLLAGGGDMAPERYNQSLICSRNIDIKRDNDELELIKIFVQKEKAVFGICRGMQVLNVAFGGDLIQDVDNTEIHAYSEQIGDRVHEIKCKEDSFLHKIYGEKIVVNSAHHQACGRLGKELKYTSFSLDNIAESLENEGKRIFAVQFHPERMSFKNKREDTVDGRYIIEFFVNQI